MIKSLIKQRNNEQPLESRPRGASSAMIGGLIGFLSFILFTSSIFFSESSLFYNGLFILQIIVIVLLSPGMLVLRVVYSGVSESTFAGLSTIVIFGISSIPFTVIGSLIGSGSKSGKKTGIILLISYGILLATGLPLWGIVWTP
jgi:hypothetical protein